MTISSNNDTQVPEQVAQPTKSTKEDNLVKIRQELDRVREEKQMLASRLEEIERSKVPPVPDDDDDDFAGEPYVDPKRFKRGLNKAKQEIKTSTKAEIEQAVQQALQEERRKGYLEKNPDFAQVMDTEVIEKFAQKHPGIAQAILKMPDSFERQQLVYEAIKGTGSHLKEQPKENIQDKINKNRQSPYYQPTGVASAPYGIVPDTSPAAGKAAYAKMQELKSKLRLS